MTNSITRAVKVVIDKHVPIRTALRNKQKQLRKPWITNAILKTIWNKQCMYETDFLSNDPAKIAENKNVSKLN